ncbi:hypothetical protein ACIRSS_15160 [Amycolatopsis sp. NPDC101161]|uniref:hypothetical protein n=1 Tax=Amycolatopsis sp. NPDC101161 TaxID=3363940 RepID=UPI00382C0E14
MNRAEHQMAVRWLANRGQRVLAPTPFIGALLATRNAAVGTLWRFLLFMVPGLAAAFGYQLAFGRALGSRTLYFVYFAMQLAMWSGIRSRQRRLAKTTHPWPGATREPWPRVLGGWFTAAVVLAYGGGVVLALSMAFTTPGRTYGLSLLGLLGLSALCQAVVLTGFLRAPALAEEPTSLAVHRALLAENIHVAAPAMVAVPPIVDTVFAEEPPGYGPLLLAYAAVVIVAELVAYVRGRRPLPPGHYGDPVPRGTEVDWSPPEAR